MANIMRLGGGGGGGKPKKLLSSLSEGSLVSVLEDGKLTPFYVAKHNYEADLNGEGRTLLVRKNLHSNRQWNAPNGNAYAESSINTWLNGDYADTLSAIVKSAVSVTNFKYTIGNGNKTLSTLGKSIFLLSAAEVGAASPNYFNAEGSLLPIASALVHATPDSGTEVRYWTRTPEFTSSVSAIYIDPSVSVIHGGVASTTQLGIRPCFTLPANMALNTEPYADGSWGLADEDVMIDTETVTTAAKAGVAYTNGIADLTPAQLHEIAAAISANPNINKDTSVVYYDKGNVHRKISTGDTHEISFSGTAYVSRVSGFNHYDLSLGTVYGSPTATGKVGILLEMVDCLAGTFQMNTSNTNSGGWASCYLRNSIVPALLEQIPGELLSAMKTVIVLSSAGSKSSTITKTEDKLFLLSEIEIFGSLTHSFSGEGSQYAYYKAGNSKVKKINGSATGWWERSPAKDTISFCNVNNAGGASGVNSGSSAPIGISLCYCI